jgi:hypothetical protein
MPLSLGLPITNMYPNMHICPYSLFTFPFTFYFLHELGPSTNVGIEVWTYTNIMIEPMTIHVQWGDTEIVALCNSKDSAHIVANFDTLRSARKLLFVHEIIGTKSLLCLQHVYQISKLEYWLKKDIEDLLVRGSCKKCFIAANFDTLPRIVDFFSHEIFRVGTSLCYLHMQKNSSPKDLQKESDIPNLPTSVELCEKQRGESFPKDWRITIFVCIFRPRKFSNMWSTS